MTRQRCWHNDWVLEFDIKGLFDNIPSELLMKAVRKHTQEKWVLLYIERWLKGPMSHVDGSIVARERGVSQGGVISPVLSNLFLHYVLDIWMQRKYPENQWCRYADDGLIHCKSEKEARVLLEALNKRFEECGLQLNSEKTKIVYCKDGARNGKYPNKSFDFLGYTFRARRCKNTKSNNFFVNFTPAVSQTAKKSMRATTRKCICNRTDLSLEDIATWFNPVLRGWINYYGKYTLSAMYPVLLHFNKTLVVWAIRKYKRFRESETQATKFLQSIARNQPQLFVHWRFGIIKTFA